MIYRNPNYWFCSGYSAVYYAAAAMLFSFYAIWLSNDIGLGSGQTGTLYASNYLIGLGIMCVYGVGQDKLVLRKHLVWLQSIVITLAAPFMIYVYEPLLPSHFYLGVVCGSCFLGVGWIAGMGLVDSWCEKLSQAFGFEFGYARTWGSLAFAVCTLVAGIVMSINPHINFWIASAAGVGFMALNAFFKPAVQATDQAGLSPSQRPRLREIAVIFRQRRFWCFVIYVMGTYSLYNVYDQQLFPVYYTQLFSHPSQGYQLYGLLGSIQVFLEALVMIAAPALVNRIGARNALIFAAAVSALRILLTSSTASVELVSVIKLMHCLEIAVILVAVFKYITQHFGTRLSASVFLIGYQVSGSLGIVIFSPVIGSFVDHAGARTAFFWLGLTVAFFMVFAAIFLERDTPTNTFLPSHSPS